MQDVRTIAKFFLSKNSMTHKKVQKLCYYAQAWHLANYGVPLVPNRFEAWVHGPVSPDLYLVYKEWGWADIPQQQDCPPVMPQEKKFLERVWETYGKYAPCELEAFACRELPWRKARGNCSPSAYSRNPISMKDMRDYYGKRIHR